MQTPEGKVKRRVIALLKRHKAYYHMPVQTGFGSPALDFHVCSAGRYAGIETKAAGNTLTDRQLAIADEIRAAGGRVFVVTDYDGMRELGDWLEATSDG